MGVAAQLSSQTGLRGLGEVHRHDRGGAAEEGDRRSRHPPVADRHEFWDTALGLVHEHLDRVPPIGPWLPLRMAGAGR
ncbi:MAG TPA: hypothetical protein VN635_05340, partial [Conexibacter sp.]|nr:hypothetical protein [Conexibacter sp.]